MIRRPPRSTLSSSSAASDVYKRQALHCAALASPRPGCGTIPSNPADPSHPGPYPVSSRVVKGLTSRNLTVEVFYPASLGEPYVLDFRALLTDPINAKIPDSAIPKMHYNNTYQSTAMNTTDGPYPVIVFVHGTAGWRSQSLNLQSHWASRGFVVVAADYPGINIKDMLLAAQLQPVPHIDQVGDTRLLVAELDSLQHVGLQFLVGHVDMSRRALIGHSAGALALQHLSDLGDVIIPMAGDGAAASSRLRSTLLLGAQNDSEVPPRTHQQPAYASTPPAKRLLIGANMGHQAFSDLCWIGEDQGGICGIGKKHGVLLAWLMQPLAVNGCSFHNQGFFEPEKNWRLIKYATSGVLEETLMCDARMTAQLAKVSEVFDYVLEYKQQLQ
eukprot:TRINITY_DN39951_c0_g2_i1.p1 TRINITY_DN39951_c0_g2~~TRINITY_DN39951_c0_g2_i1.p1  ORF type:complete len:386 (-),score=87.83 TRINITY_DN39951_c0_g2_i1:203-1360(-)